MSNDIKIPVPVLEKPHWRVNFRSIPYKGKAAISLKECNEIIQKNKVSLRGWDYPHIDPKNKAHGNNWVASWTIFNGHVEYWRFYQSTQFIHLFSVLETTRPEWKAKIDEAMEWHLGYRKDIDWNSVPGYFSIINFLYTVTEIYEFATRLCQSEIYKDKLNIDIQLNNIHGFMLAADKNRRWDQDYHSDEDTLLFNKEYIADDMIVFSHKYALDTVIHFFERFGWLSPTESLLKEEQDKFLRGKF